MPDMNRVTWLRICGVLVFLGLPILTYYLVAAPSSRGFAPGIRTTEPWRVTAHPIPGLQGEAARLAADVARYQRVRPTNGFEVFHRCRVEVLLPDSASQAKARDELIEILNHDRFMARYPQAAPLLRPTGWGGWEVRRLSADRNYTPKDMERLQGEVHADQLVATCGEIGLDPAHPITSGGESLTVGELVESARRGFVVGQESEWSVAAFCAYRPDEPEWVNRFGEQQSYAGLADELAKQELSTGACAGSHRLYALCMLLQLDATRPFFPRATRERVTAQIQMACDALRRTQRPSGAWDTGWASGSSWNGGRDLPRTLVHVTAHHLEWLIICPPEARPPDAVIVKAYRFVSDSAAQQPDSVIRDQYCPYSHFARVAALQLSAGERP